MDLCRPFLSASDAHARAEAKEAISHFRKLHSACEYMGEVYSIAQKGRNDGTNISSIYCLFMRHEIIFQTVKGSSFFFMQMQCTRIFSAYFVACQAVSIGCLLNFYRDGVLACPRTESISFQNK